MDCPQEENEFVNSLPSLSELLLEIPLYKEIELPIRTISEGVDNFSSELDKIYHFQEIVDCYCLECGKESIFEKANKSSLASHYSILNIIEGQVTHKLVCQRDKSHTIYISFLIKDQKLTKIGQYPSIASLKKPELKKYRSVLKGKFQELNKAVGLSAHGVGIGAFVYLRRIFEYLIEEAHTRISQSSEWNEKLESDYQKSKVIDKIKFLETELPEFLVENRQIYSILSKGIHLLTEEECLESFPVMMPSIELILDQYIAEQEKEKKIKDIEKRINDYHAKYKDN